MAINLELNKVAAALNPEQKARATAIATQDKPIAGPPAPVNLPGYKPKAGPPKPVVPTIPMTPAQLQRPAVIPQAPTPAAPTAPLSVGNVATKLPSYQLTPEEKARATAIAQSRPPGKVEQFVQDTARAPFRALASVFAKDTYTPTAPYQKTFLGAAPITPIAQRVANNELTLKDMGVKHGALPLSLAGVVGSTAFDLIPGLPEKNAAEHAGEEAGAALLKKQLSTVDEVLKAAKSGTGGEVAREFKGAQFNLTPNQTENLAKIQASLGLGHRQVRTFEDMTALASELGTDPKQLLKTTHTGQITDQEVAGISQLIKTNSDFITSATKNLDTVTTSAEKDALQTKIAAADAQIKQALTKLRIGNTENGRAIVANRILARNSLDPVFWYKKVESQLTSHGQDFTPEIRSAVDDLINKRDTSGLALFVANLNTPTKIEKAVTLWKAGLLTSPTTHLANVMGNITMAGAENASDVVATGLDKFISLFTGKRTKSFSLAGVDAQTEGAIAGIKKAPNIIRNGRDLEDALNKAEIPRTTEFKNPILDRYTKTVFGTLSAEDKVFKETALKGSLYEQARVQALNEKLTGKAFKARVKFLYEHPSTEMTTQAINDAEFRTFNNPNKLSNAAANFKRTLGPGGKAAAEVVAPFTKTPTNIAARMVDYSPAGIVKTLITQINPETRGQKALVEGLARGITGSSVIALGGLLAAKGLMTGNNPTDPKEKAQWELEGKQAHAVKLGDKWINLNRISPVGNLLSLGADMYGFHQQNGGGLLAESGNALASGAKGLTEQTFLKGVSGALGAVTDPNQNAESYVSSTLAGLIPSVVTRTGQVFNPVVRSPKGITESFEAKIPGLMSKVPPRRDALGNIQKYNGLGRLIDPFDTRTESQDPVVNELKKLDTEHKGIITTPDTSFKSLKLTSQDKDRYLNVVGKITRDTLAKGIQSDEYKKLKPDEKLDAIQKAVSNIRSAARAAFIAAQVAKELNAAKTKTEQAQIWDQYDKDGTLTKAAATELRKLINEGKVQVK